MIAPSLPPERARSLRTAMLLAVIAILYLPKLFWPASAIYQRILSEAVLNVLAATTKLAALASGVVFAARSAARLDRDNPARPSWWMLTVFLAGFLVGQIVLSVYELVLRVSPPLPSLGDAFFLLGYAMMIAATARFVRVYRASGLPLGHRLEHPILALVASLVFIVVGIPILAPIAHAPEPLGERAINVAYPVLDFVALVPTVVLVRITWHFRGGRVWTVWATLLGGLVCASGGDIVFAYATSAKHTELWPLVDGLLMASYVLLGRGAALQDELLRDA
jgi:hypothetical protein